MNVKLVRKGKEYSGTAAELHLRQELKMAENRFKTMEGFLSSIASYSRETGQEYLIKQWDATTLEASHWFREIATMFIIEGQ